MGGTACHGRLACDLAALRLPELRISLELGVTALLLGLLLVLRARRERERAAPGPGVNPTPAGTAARSLRRDAGGPRAAERVPEQGIVGLLLAAVTLTTLAVTGHLQPGLAVAVGLLVAGAGAAAGAGRGGGAVRGGLGPWARLPSGRRRGLGAVPGAAVLALGTGLPAPLVARLLAGCVVILVAVTLPGFERRHRRTGLGPVLLAAAAVGCYETVPTPDLVLVLAGGALTLALLAWPRPVACLGRAGPASVAVFAWAAVAGGQGRPVTMITGLASLGLLLLEPGAARLARRSGSGRTPLGRLRPGRPAATLVVAAGQLALGALLSQAYVLTGGGAGDVALTLAALAAAGGILLLWAAPPAVAAGRALG